MAELENFYNEHATQTRQHEDHRERMTNIILTINGALIAIIGFSGLTWWSLWPSSAIVLLGVYGYFFAGKHYERSRYHTSIMGAIRSEIDKLYLNPDAPKRSMKDLRDEGVANHYRNFKWPVLRPRKEGALSFIARQRVHVFWELVHVLLILFGLALTVTIILNKDVNAEKILKVRIVQ